MTKIKQLIEKAVKDWPIKLACFVVAVLLYIFHQTSLFDKRSFVLPVTVQQNGIVMPVGDYEKTVIVTVRASTEQVSSVHANQIHVSLNIDSITKNGEYSVPVNVTVDDQIMGFDPFEIKVKPESIKIKVEKKGLKYAKIEPGVVGSPAHGYEVSDVTVTPDYVELSGPESVLEQIDTIETQKVDITNLKNNVSFDVNGVGLGKVITVDDEGPYKVDVTIVPQMMEKTFNNYKVQAVNLSSDFYINGELPYTNVTLTGTVPQLEAFNLNAYSVQVDFSSVKAAGSYTLPVKYVYPSYFKLKENPLETITVEISEVVKEEPEIAEASEENSVNEENAGSEGSAN